jgi:hypothetical protein
MVSALLIGGNVMVAKGQNAGADFQNIPACRSGGDRLRRRLSTFLNSPPPDAFFGGPDTGVRQTCSRQDVEGSVSTRPRLPAGLT